MEIMFNALSSCIPRAAAFEWLLKVVCVLQCVAVHCSVLQKMNINALSSCIPRAAAFDWLLLVCVAVCCSVLQCVAVCCSADCYF